MQKFETSSDTVFEQGLSEILTSDVETKHNETIEAVNSEEFFNLTDTPSIDKKHSAASEMFLRIFAGLAAFILLIFFVSSITSRF